MKKTQQCPKCESLIIGTFPEVFDLVTAKEDAQGGTFNGCKMFQVTVYVCGDCGYYEKYLKTMPADRETPLDETDVKFTWIRRPPEPKGPYR